MRIDRQMLLRHQACREGLEWFSSQWPAESTSFADGLAALQRDGHRDFLAWVALHVPELRALAPPELVASVLGPRWSELAMLADSLSTFRWLAPTAPPDELAALVHMHAERLVAQSGASAGFTASAVVPLEVAWSEVVPPVSESWDAQHGEGPPPLEWAASWRCAYRAAQQGGEPAAEAALQALLASAQVTTCAPSQAQAALGLQPALWFEQRQRIIGDLSVQLRSIAKVAQQVCRTVDDIAFLRCYGRAKRCFAAASQEEAFSASGRSLWYLTGQHTGEQEAVVHGASTVAATARLDVGAAALWLLADVRAPSPFAPILEIWRLGYWPAGPVNGTFLIGDPNGGQ